MKTLVSTILQLMGSCIILSVLLSCAFMYACTPGEAKTANTVISDAIGVGDLICAEESGATTVTAVQALCSGLATLTPAQQTFLESLLEQKSVAKKMGFTWRANNVNDASTGSSVLSLDSGK